MAEIEKIVLNQNLSKFVCRKFWEFWGFPIGKKMITKIAYQKWNLLKKKKKNAFTVLLGFSCSGYGVRSHSLVLKNTSKMS